MLAGTAVFFVAAALLGGGVASRLSSGGFEDPSSESSRARAAIEREFGEQQPDLILLVTSKRGTADDPEVAAAGSAITARLGSERGVARAISYWDLGSPPPLRSADGRQALVIAALRGDEDAVHDTAEELSPRYSGSRGPVTVRVGGFAEVFRQVNTQVEEDLLRGELLAFPIVLLLTVLVFGSVVAAGLPLLVGILAIVGTFLVLLVLSSLTQVSIFSLNLTTALGARARDRLQPVRRLAVPGGAARRARSARRGGAHRRRPPASTVAFSAVTVAISLSALLVFPLAFLRSFAYAGIGGRGARRASAPSSSSPRCSPCSGPRVNSRGAVAAPRAETSRRRRLASDRDVRDATPGADRDRRRRCCSSRSASRSFASQFGLPDDRVLPPDLSSRQVQDDDPGAILVERGAARSRWSRPGSAIRPPALPSVDRYAAQLSRLAGCARVDAFTGSYIDGQQVARAGTASATRFQADDATWLSVVPSVEPYSDAGERLVNDGRATPRAVRRSWSPGRRPQLVDSKRVDLRPPPDRARPHRRWQRSCCCS